MISGIGPKDQEGLLKQFRQMQGTFFEKYLQLLSEKTDHELRHCSHDDFLQRQGRAQLLEELLGDISGSRAELQKLDRPKPDMSKSF